jgi:hypothetical protein
MKPKSEISACTASRNGGCFKMAGTVLNDVKIVGNLDYTPKISGIKVDSIQAAHGSYTKNGGFLYLSARNQDILIKNVLVTGASLARGNGGFIFTESSVA